MTAAKEHLAAFIRDQAEEESRNGSGRKSSFLGGVLHMDVLKKVWLYMYIRGHPGFRNTSERGRESAVINGYLSHDGYRAIISMVASYIGVKYAIQYQYGFPFSTMWHSGSTELL